MKFAVIYALVLSALSIPSLVSAQNALAGPSGKSIQFKTIYRDLYNKLLWGQALEGTYTNGCVNAGDKYEASKCTLKVNTDGTRQVTVDSNAEKACRDIGARLPTASEYMSLIRNFDHTETEKYLTPVLTKKGKLEIRSVFGDFNNWSCAVFGDNHASGNFCLFQTASIWPRDGEYTFVFNVDMGYSIINGRRDQKYYGVRCVRDSQ